MNTELKFQLNRSTSVDHAKGSIRGATVAKAGVEAIGKFVYLDVNGQVTRNAGQACKKLPVYTDAKMLDTLMAAAQDAGGRVKVRSDHDDSISARAGFADNFRKV